MLRHGGVTGNLVVFKGNYVSPGNYTLYDVYEAALVRKWLMDHGGDGPAENDRRGYYVFPFFSSGTFTSFGYQNAIYLIVGGGGAGGGAASQIRYPSKGAGGGAGGFVTGNIDLAPGDYAVTVGAGGAAIKVANRNTQTLKGTNGGDTYFANVYANGGGAGGTTASNVTTDYKGNDGGSGGGGTRTLRQMTGGDAGLGIPGQGSNGYNYGGGGGSGITVDNTRLGHAGFRPDYWLGRVPQLTGEADLAGGGAGGSYTHSDVSYHDLKFPGGGGNLYTDGSTNTGGGGGGANGDTAGSSDYYFGGNGGSGLAVIAVPITKPPPFTIYNLDQYKFIYGDQTIYKITQSCEFYVTGIKLVDWLVVGGGGGAASGCGGGGGGVMVDKFNLYDGKWTVTIGAGGASRTNGGTTVVTNQIDWAIHGIGGGAAAATNAEYFLYGAAGGSGGGGWYGAGAGSANAGGQALQPGNINGGFGGAGSTGLFFNALSLGGSHGSYGGSGGGASGGRDGKLVSGFGDPAYYGAGGSGSGYSQDGDNRTSYIVLGPGKGGGPGNADAPPNSGAGGSSFSGIHNFQTSYAGGSGVVYIAFLTNQ
jgi:hypothetical protein